MTRRLVMCVFVMMPMIGVCVSAQIASATLPGAARYVDPVNGLSIDEAIARALAQEPSLRGARSRIEVAEAMRHQASLRANPSVSFERRIEPGGTDSLTSVGVEWPLDLSRRDGRLAVASREIGTAQLAVADRERTLAAAVRSRYGDVLASVRNLGILDDLVATARRQLELLRARVDEGASPPLERDLVDVELRRLESERLLQAGRTEAAMVDLKRAIGMPVDPMLTVRHTLEDLVVGQPALARDAGELSKRTEQRADVREAAARIEVADARIDRAQRDGRVDVSLFANYMRMDSGFPQFGVEADGRPARVRGLFHYVSAGAMVTLPVLNRNQGESGAAQAERAGAVAEYEAARLAASAEVAAAVSLDEHARAAVQLYSGGGQTLARQNLAVVRQSYEFGRVTVFDVLAEQRRYLDVERSYTVALQAAYEARTALTRALGDVR